MIIKNLGRGGELAHTEAGIMACSGGPEQGIEEVIGVSDQRKALEEAVKRLRLVNAAAKATAKKTAEKEEEGEK